MDTDKAYRVKTRWQLHKNALSYTEHILEATSREIAAVLSPTAHL